VFRTHAHRDHPRRLHHVAVYLLYTLIPVPLLGLFSASDYMLSIGVVAIRRCSAQSDLRRGVHHHRLLVSGPQAFQMGGLHQHLPARAPADPHRPSALPDRGGSISSVTQPIADFLTLLISGVLCRKLILELRAEQKARGLSASAAPDDAARAAGDGTP
jgi:hypothetical protein